MSIRTHLLPLVCTLLAAGALPAGAQPLPERVQVGDGPAVVAPTDDGVWVTNFGDGTVWYLSSVDG